MSRQIWLLSHYFSGYNLGQQKKRDNFCQNKALSQKAGGTSAIWLLQTMVKCPVAGKEISLIGTQGLDLNGSWSKLQALPTTGSITVVTIGNGWRPMNQKLGRVLLHLFPRNHAFARSQRRIERVSTPTPSKPARFQKYPRRPARHDGSLQAVAASPLHRHDNSNRGYRDCRSFR